MGHAGVRRTLRDAQKSATAPDSAPSEDYPFKEALDTINLSTDVEWLTE